MSNAIFCLFHYPDFMSITPQRILSHEKDPHQIGESLYCSNDLLKPGQKGRDIPRILLLQADLSV
jgi:hypothetical protein